MKKIIYISTITILSIVAIVLGTFALKKKPVVETITVETMTDIPAPNTETDNAGGIELVEKPKEEITANTDDLSASEYKNFEDTIDKLSILTK